jgi:hypothetical protein
MGRTAPVTTAGDERRHQAGPEDLWGESFAIDFARTDGTGGFLRLGLYSGGRSQSGLTS